MPPQCNAVICSEIVLEEAAGLFKMSPQFWMRLQADWDLHEAIERHARKVS